MLEIKATAATRAMGHLMSTLKRKATEAKKAMATEKTTVLTTTMARRRVMDMILSTAPIATIATPARVTATTVQAMVNTLMALMANIALLTSAVTAMRMNMANIIYPAPRWKLRSVSGIFINMWIFAQYSISIWGGLGLPCY